MRQLPNALTDADIVLKDINSNNFKAVVLNTISAEYVEMLNEDRHILLAMRAVAEKAASYKDAKQMSKKYADIIPTHEEELTKFKTNIKVCKSMMHVYLQDG